MYSKTRNSKSILQNNLGNSITDKSDLFIPKELWDMETLRKTPTRLKDIFEATKELETVRQQVENEKTLYQKDIRVLNSETEGQIQNWESDLKREKEIKVQEFEDKRKSIKRDKKNILRKLEKNIIEKKEELIKEFDLKYKSDLNNIKSLYDRIQGILDKYQVRIEENIDLYDEFNWDDITYRDIVATIDEIESKIDEIFNSDVAITGTWNKVKNFTEKENKLVGLGVLASTLFAAPITLIGAGITIGIAISENKKINETLAEYCIRLVQLQHIIKYMYQKRKKDNTIDIKFLESELKESNSAIEAKEKNLLEELSKEEEDWNKDYEERKSIDIRSEKQLLLDNNVRVKDEQYKEKVNGIKQIEAKILEKLKDLREKMDKKNNITPIENKYDEKSYKDIKLAKEIKEKFIKYNMMKNLTFKKRQEFIDKYGNDIPTNVMQQIEYDYELFNSDFTPLKEDIENYKKSGINSLEDAEQLYKLALEKEVPLCILDTNKFHLGQITKSNTLSSIEDNEEVFAGNWDNESVLFVYKNEEEEKFLINFIKYLAIQGMAYTKTDSLQVNIFNPTKDTKFNDILINTTTYDKNGKAVKNPPYSTNYSDTDLSDLIINQNNIIKNRYKEEFAGTGLTLRDVIAEKKKSGSKTPFYTLNIIHRMEESIDDILTVSENSNIHGYINYILIPYHKIVDKEKSDGKETLKMADEIKYKYKKLKIIVQVADIINENEAIINVFNKNITDYKQIRYKSIPKEVILRYISYLSDRYKEFLSKKTINMVTEYISEVLGDKLWQGDATKGLRLHFGYVNGDKSRPEPVLMDENDQVHMFVGGTTGGGKSVTMSFLTNVMTMEYAPNQVEIYYYDFKKVEIESHIKPYKWANCKAMSASETGDYIISLMEDIKAEMDIRYNNMTALGVSKLSDYIKKLNKIKEEFIKNGEFEKAKNVIIPGRTLILIDEVQQAFSIDDDVTERFMGATEDLLRLARAAGLHIIFISQDPGKIPANLMALFKLRACTKADPTVSNAVLNNNFCSLPENSFIGFMGVNTSGSGDPEKNIQYVVPLSEADHTKLYKKISCDRFDNLDPTDKDYTKNAVVFKDDNKFSFDDLDTYLGDNNLEPGEIVLGDIVKFQKKYEPAKIKLEPDQIQGLAFVSAEKQYKIDFFETVVKSINKTGGKAVAFFGSDADSDFKTDLIENTMANEYFIIDNETGKEVVELEYRNQIIESRNEAKEELRGLEEDLSNLKYKLAEMSDDYKEEWLRDNPDLDYDSELQSISYEMVEIEEKIETLNRDIIERYSEQIARPRFHYQKHDYGNRPGYSDTESPDLSMYGTMEMIMSYYKDLNKNLKREGKPIQYYYIIAIDPDKDKYEVSEKVLRDKEYQAILNEASSYWVFFITITSKFDNVAKVDFNKYIMGIKMPQEASTEKPFKNPVKGLSQLSDEITPSNSFKFKLPTRDVTFKMPWEA